MLKPYAEKFRRNLDESVIPFWLKHSPDREFGGYFTCLDREGRIYDTKKYLWLQGRAVWMFSRLYNAWEKRQEFLDFAKLVLDFTRRHAFDPKGRPYFSVTREGKPFFFQRKPYAAVFIMLGLLEYSRATADPALRKEAKALFWKILGWIDKPSLLDRPALEGLPETSSLANVMCAASMALEFVRDDRDPRYLEIIRKAMSDVVRHYDPDRRILLETVRLDGGRLLEWPEGRTFNAGHSIEVAWFLLHMTEVVPDPKLRAIALDVLEGSLEFGWDHQYGGLYYFQDIEGHPPLQYEHNLKLWWPITEAMYALVLAQTLAPRPFWLTWLEKLVDYGFKHFVDPKHGEWFGYCDRQGNRTSECKGNHYKGCFHVPRALLYCVQRIEGKTP
jgi:N-acylglucosamine 2-epimerase